MTYGIEGKHYKVENGNYIRHYRRCIYSEEYGIGMVFVAWTGVGFDRKINPAQFEFGDKHALDMKHIFQSTFTSLPSMNLYWDELDNRKKETYIRMWKRVLMNLIILSHSGYSGGEQLLKEANEWYNSCKIYKISIMKIHSRFTVK